MRRIDQLLAIIGLQRIHKPSNVVRIENITAANADAAVLEIQRAQSAVRVQQLRKSQARVIANIRAAEAS